jgi:mRNA-degrading endonuclease HigB of HigAB toxin-antitoxin module
VNVIGKGGLRKLTAKHRGVESEALDWYRVAASADWTCFAGVRGDLPMIGQVLAFNLAHNRDRLITTVFFATREIYVKDRHKKR